MSSLQTIINSEMEVSHHWLDLCYIDFIIDKMDFNISKPHIEWIKLREKNVSHYVKILQVGGKKQEYMKFPLEMKKDPDLPRTFTFLLFLFC